MKPHVILSYEQRSYLNALINERCFYLDGEQRRKLQMIQSWIAHPAPGTDAVALTVAQWHDVLGLLESHGLTGIAKTAHAAIVDAIAYRNANI